MVDGGRRSPEPHANPQRLTPHSGAMDDAVRDYNRCHRPRAPILVRPPPPAGTRGSPDAAVVLSHQMPTYKVDRRRLFVGVWKRGVSIDGRDQGRDAGFTARHPELNTSKGTIQLRPDDAAGIPDDEFRDLARAALDG